MIEFIQAFALITANIIKYTCLVGISLILAHAVYLMASSVVSDIVDKIKRK